MWHYVQNNQAYGPVDTAVVQGLLKAGSLSLDALVWKEGMSGWLPARTIPDFAAVAPAGTAPPPIPPLTMPPRSTPPPLPGDTDDIDRNRIFAVLGYFGILFVVPLLAAPRSRFARYHANQGIILFIAMCVAVAGPLVPFVGLILIPVHLILWLALFVLFVMGIVHAAAGEYKPLPVIGNFQILS